METNLIPAPEPGATEEKVNLRHYWHVILERRWLAITAFVSVFVLCLIYLVKAPRIYQATTRMQIDREFENVLDLKDAFSFDGREQDYLQTQYKNLQSRTLIESVIKQLGLEKDPRYAKNPDIVRAVFDDISVVPIRMSRLVDIKVEHPEPQKAADIANTLVKTFIENNLDQKQARTIEAVRWLRTEVNTLQKDVEAAEADLQKYRKQSGSISLEENQNIARQGLLQAQADFDKARSEASRLQREVQEAENLIQSGTGIENLPDVVNDLAIKQMKYELAQTRADLASLLKTYKNRHPKVVEKRERIADLQSSIEDASHSVFSAMKTRALLAKATEQQMEAKLKEREKEQITLMDLRIRYDELTRQARKSEMLYNIVLEKMKGTELLGKDKSNNMRPVDRAARPVKPVKPRIVLTIFLGLVGGVGVALCLVFFVNYLDDSIKSQDDVETYLRLPFLGYVPNIKTNSLVERDLQAHVHPQSNAAESFRTIRAAVSLSHKAEHLQVTSVTSTIPSEGKSLVASNLAIVTAQTGMKTLLVDADLRRPSVHKAHQLHSPIGLSAYLTEKVNSVDEFVHPTDVPHLDVVCCGAVPSSPSELIGSKRMMQFLKEVRARYDRVILDCPPISAVSDPLIIAAMSDGVLFVTKFNKIRREHARKSVQRLHDAGIHVFGVVLNDIDFEGRDSYYYSYYYYQNRYYASHYKSAKTPPGKGEPAEVKKS
ncbi:MAG: polysaccharide biosynthesis tyrosine autokinase [Verrucomicrobia bacterium]|nr:polysaccharide biosynthesis tyrosine autokinase [Verrucomicrobiota bacterium]